MNAAGTLTEQQGIAVETLEKKNEALEKAKGTYGRFKDAVKYIDPRNE